MLVMPGLVPVIHVFAPHQNLRTAADHANFAAAQNPRRAAGLSPAQWSTQLQSAKERAGRRKFMLQAPSTIETRDSWVVASVALFVMMMAFGRC